MNISAPFIKRPVGTTLLALALFLVGAVALAFLPVASLPAIDFPAIGIFASRPGADPATMAASVAAPLERRLANIASLVELTSSSALGSTQIVAQFGLDRKIDSARRATCRRRSTRPTRTCRPTCQYAPPFARPINPRRQCSSSR